MIAGHCLLRSSLGGRGTAGLPQLFYVIRGGEATITRRSISTALKAALFTTQSGIPSSTARHATARHGTATRQGDTASRREISSRGNMYKWIDLPSGGKMPALGFGTWQASDAELDQAVEAALETGYRHIDTAAAYENEAVIGRVINRWIDAGKLKREDLFICTKVPPSGNRPEGVEKFIRKSLENLGLDYLDLYLVHTPFGFQDKGDDLHPMGENGEILLDVTTDHLAIWKTMESQVDAGRARAIGLSNFTIPQIRRVLSAARIPPANLQVELHVYCQQRELVEFCREKGITMTAYAPLGSRGTAKIFQATGVSKELPDLMATPEVTSLAEKLKRTPAQVLLRYTLQRGVAVIPKSTNQKRIKENFALYDFELSADDMATLEKLDHGSAGRVVDFSFFKGLSKHPEFPF